MTDATTTTTAHRKGLKFRGAEGDFDVYEFFKGNRAVFEVSVNRTDPELKIHVGRVGATWAKVNEIDKDIADHGDLFETVGRARLKEDGSRVSADSIKTYVRPRAFSILANLFVAPAPQPKAPIDSPFSDPMPILTDEQIAAAEEKPKF